MVKKLLVNLTMLSLFGLLLAFAAWLVWMYYFRGPIDLESRGFVSKTLEQEVVQPTEVEKFTLPHFHNLDESVLQGIEYPSTCVNCHGDYPHNKTIKVRAFYNAHSWFIACEVCHGGDDHQQNRIYRWLDSETDVALSKLEGEAGVYGARIVPILQSDQIWERQDNLIGGEAIIKYSKIKQALNEDKQREAIESMHEVLRSEAVSCKQCHTENGLLDFSELLYPENMARHLQVIDTGSMIDKHDEFFFPKVLEAPN